MSAPVSAAAGESAEAVLRRHGKTFHFAQPFLGKRHANRAARLYRFCRYVDDLADESPNRSRAGEELSGLSVVLDRGVTTGDPIADDFITLCQETRMDLKLGILLIRGVRSDLGDVAIADEHSLLRYAYHVAGVVGLMMCKVLDVETDQAHPFAIDLGIAMQLTNIARDISEDAKMGRRYLPASWINVSSLDYLVEPKPSTEDDLRAANERLLSVAETYYDSAASGMAYLPLRARFTIYLASALYRRIGSALAARDYAYWLERASLSTPEKVQHSFGAALRFLSTPQLHRAGASHRAALHEALIGLPGVNALSGG